MSDPTAPVNLSSIERRATQESVKSALVQQLGAKVRLVEDMEEAFNPAAAERGQMRQGRLRTLPERRASQTSEKGRIKEVDQKSEEDLAHTYQRRNPELLADRLRALKSSLRAGQTPEEILGKVTEAFPDATLADEALEFLEQDTEGELLDAVQRARVLHNSLKGREVVAGRNIDTVAKSFYEKGLGESPTVLRDLYRDVTGNPCDHNELFTNLSKTYGFDELKVVVAFLLKGLSYDLKSKGPSITQAELMLLMTETRNLQSILWVYLFFKSRKKTLKLLYQQQGIDEKKQPHFERLAKEFINLVKERYPSVLKLLKQLEGFGSLEDVEKILLLMQYRDATRQLSPRLYRSLKHRQDLLLIILEALEELEEQLSKQNEEGG